MCRLLYVRSERSFDICDHLRPFAELSRNSTEYQGHGWGCAFLRNDQWQFYHDSSPVWEDDVSQFGQTTLLMTHARSAFENRDIRVDNNMPFYDADHVFIFNGELRGVRIKEEGRIGAEKIFNYIKRLDSGDIGDALARGVGIINKRTKYVKAMNIIIGDKQHAYVSTLFNADPDYFTLHEKLTAHSVMVCSEPYPASTGWVAIPNNTTRVY